MATAQVVPGPEGHPHHRRTKSAALKSFIQHTLSKGTGQSTASSSAFVANGDFYPKEDGQYLPLEDSHNRVFSELPQNRQSYFFSTKKSGEHDRSKTNGDSQPLQKRTKSAISLKSLAGRDADKHSKAKSSSPEKPKKTKSSTNLAALLSRPRSSKNLKKAAAQEQTREDKDKENRTPSNSPLFESSSRPPIYAQFSTQHFTTQPLGGKFLEDEIDLYTPQAYNASNQRNFFTDQESQPTLGRPDGTRRPKSTFLPSSYSVQDIQKHVSASLRRSAEQPRPVPLGNRVSVEISRAGQESKSDLTMAKRGSRVMAAVAAFGSKPKATEIPSRTSLDIKDVDVEFEAMLDRRNIPEHHKYKMRSLALSMKKDFIRQDWAETAAVQSNRPQSKGAGESAERAFSQLEDGELKVKRPRSRTFTLSKSHKDLNAVTLKGRPDGTLRGHSRTKSSDSTSSRTLTSTSASVASNLIAKAKGQLPDDFVTYLRKVAKPESVEVGKLHKLRLLLRNETVAWTDEFIGLGGIKEIVGLLYRTLEVEWREEHEDALLHEVLLCLKALCTTALALQHLNDIQDTLFPALLHMLFDEEKKGPSEFTTRNIVTSLLFTYLKSAPLPERPLRAQVLLSHLRDPEPKEEERPVGFVLEMRRDRPYRVWCKDAVNVTKEVFWIFLHNLNVVALPKKSGKKSVTAGNSEEDAEAGILSISAAVSNSASFDAFNPHHLYMIRHFPQELPPVPAAPYVGGVEWDATNYLASHLDLINGILSSLETKDQRNALREQLQISGWERCMGGSLRLCKEKLYGGVHAGLKNWVAAALEDGWDVRDVRCGPPAEAKSPSRKSPSKKKVEDTPRIEMPKLDFGRAAEKGKTDDGWL